MLGEITRCCADHTTARSEVAGHQARVWQHADAHDHIEALVHHVDESIGEFDVDL